MPLPRPLIILIGIAWLSGVGWYWLQEVPLKPTLSIKVPYGFRLIGVTPQGEVVAERTTGNDEGGLVAPIQMWSLQSGLKTRSMLQRGDVVVSSADFASGRVCIQRGGRFLVIDVSTGNAVDELPSDAREAVCDAALAGRILYSTGNALRLRDPVMQQDVWSNPEFASWRGIGNGYIVVRPGSSPGFGAPATAVRIEDGHSDDRFDQHQPLMRVSLAPGGEIALVATLGRQQICDAETGLIRWGLPGSVTQPQFSESGEQITSVWTDEDGRFREARWDALSGTVLAAAPKRQRGAAMRTWSSNGRYSVDSRAISQPWLAGGSTSAWKASIGWTSLSLRWVGMEAATELRDHSTGRSLGKISERLQSVTMLPDDSGVVTAWNNRIEFFSFEPRRDYVWLVVWGFMPIVTVWLGARFRRPAVPVVVQPPRGLVAA
jgi:hypothetical protein